MSLDYGLGTITTTTIYKLSMIRFVHKVHIDVDF